jgi:hypothetical protein
MVHFDWASVQAAGQGRDSMAIAGMGLLCGWRIVKDAKGGVRFYAPNDDPTSFTIPLTTNLAFGIFRQKVKTIVRHRGEANAPELASMPFSVAVEQLITFLKLDPSHAKVLRDAVGEAPSVETERAPSRPAEEAEPPKRHRKRRVTIEQPWSAHGTVRRDGLAETYPSNAVMQRSWSDQTTDYYCRWEGCDYESDNPRSVASHYTSHRKGKGRNPQPEADGVDPDHLPRKAARVRRLKSEVQGAIDAAKAQGMEADAQWIAQWIIDHRVGTLAEDRGDEGDTELSPEQIIDKIVALADRGRSKMLREQIEALQQQVDAYDDQVAEQVAEQVKPYLDTSKVLAQRVDELQRRAESAEGELEALADMLNSRRKS